MVEYVGCGFTACRLFVIWRSNVERGCKLDHFVEEGLLSMEGSLLL